MNKQPNLVYVFADQLRYQSCGYSGDPRARTPNLDRLAAQAVDFCNAVSGHPVCSAYRASLFTGKYTSSTGMVINELRMNPNHRCVGHVLTDSGYRTAYIGKWHMWANQLGHHDKPENACIPAGPYRLGFDGFWAGYNFWHHYNTGRYYDTHGRRIDVPGYEPDYQTGLAIDWLRETRDHQQPFALFLSFGTPHDPWDWHNAPDETAAHFKDIDFPLPPNYKPDNDPYADQWARFRQGERECLNEWQRVYYAMTENLDHNLGRLLREMEELGISDNTIFVFTSDHGEMFGAQGRRAKNIFYEEAVRVPFLLRWPGKTRPGGKINACLNTPDIMPTLLGLMGLPCPAEVEGMNLSHLVLERAGPEPEAAFMQCTGATAAWEDGFEWRALRDKRFTYAVMRRDQHEFLFDRGHDPWQTRNLADDPSHTHTLQRFRRLLQQRMTELDDTFAACTWYRDHWTRNRIITHGPQA